jgi:hypothetical protein
MLADTLQDNFVVSEVAQVMERDVVRVRHNGVTLVEGSYHSMRALDAARKVVDLLAKM